MKVIFNTDNHSTQVLKGTAFYSFTDAIFTDESKFVCHLNGIDIFRNTNKENGNPTLLLINHFEVSEARIIEFDTLIEMFHFIDGISIFKTY